MLDGPLKAKAANMRKIDLFFIRWLPLALFLTKIQFAYATDVDIDYTAIKTTDGGMGESTEFPETTR